jgi:hypothetical protein
MKQPKLGNVNHASLATLFKNGKPVATCMDTPNALAYGFAMTGAQTAKSVLGTCKATDMKDRVAAKGWFNKDSDAMFKRI